MKINIFLIFLFSLVTTNCFAAGSSEIENFKRKYILSMLGNVYSVAINPNGKQIAAETSHGYKVFDLKTGKELYTFLEPQVFERKRPREEIQIVSRHINFIYSPDGSQIMAPIDNEIIIWDSKTGKELRRLLKEQTYFSDQIDDGYGSYNTGWKAIIYPMSFNSAAYSPDSKYVAAISCPLGEGGGWTDGCIRIWDVNSGRQLLDNMKLWFAPFVFYSKDGKSIGASSFTSGIYLSTVQYSLYKFNAETGEEQDVPDSIFYPINFNSIAVQRYDERDRPKWRSCSPDGLRHAKVDRNDKDRNDIKYYVQIFDTKTGQKLTEHLGSSPLSVEPVIITYNPQGTRIFAGLVDGSIKVWDSTTGQEITTLNYDNSGSISSAQFSKDGNYLVIGTSNGNIVLLGK